MPSSSRTMNGRAFTTRSSPVTFDRSVLRRPVDPDQHRRDLLEDDPRDVRAVREAPVAYGQSFISGRLARWERLEHLRDRLLGRVAGLVRIGRDCIGSDTAPQRLFALRIEDVHQERSWLVLHRRSGQPRLGNLSTAILPIRGRTPRTIGLRPLPRSSRPRPVLRLAEHRPILGRPSPFRCPNVFAYPWSRCRTTSPAGRRTCGSATASMPARRLRADWCRDEQPPIASVARPIAAKCFGLMSTSGWHQCRSGARDMPRASVPVRNGSERASVRSEGRTWGST